MKECYVCGKNTLYKRVGSVRDDSKLDVLQCSFCGLITLSDFSHIHKDFYASSQMRVEDKEQTINEILKKSERDDRRRFLFLEDEIKSNDIVFLDYGCGSGGFLFLLNDHLRIDKKNLYGIELENKTREYLISCGVIVVKDLGEYEKHVNNKVDFVTMFHVLEHLQDPMHTLEKLKNVLKENGKILIEVPNANDSLLSMYECEAFSNFTFWSPHLYTFNMNSFEIMAKKVGYKINYIKQIQRYPLSNHMYWLKRGIPGGHNIWKFLNGKSLNLQYEKMLRENNACDTLLVEIQIA